MMKLEVTIVVIILTIYCAWGQGNNPKPFKCPEDDFKCDSPKKTCSQDSDCSGDLKCCGDGSGGSCCKVPRRVFCTFRDSNGKEYNGECKLPQYCDKKQVGCSGIKCTGAGEGCICCFRRKKDAPPKDICNPPEIKPGKCPRVSPEPCNECTKDRDCNTNQKCCNTCCVDPTIVSCGYRDQSNNKEYRGTCKLPSQCKKPERLCLGFKCTVPWDDCFCCFRKGQAPPKKICKNGPPAPVTRCTIIKDENTSWTGVCKDLNDCKAPSKERFPCKFDKCPNNQVCCYKKKTRPPAGPPFCIAP